MATHIPALNRCKPRMTPGERRLPERLEQTPEDDSLLWYCMPIGTSGRHPDFRVRPPHRGLLVRQVKYGALASIQAMGDDIRCARVMTSRAPSGFLEKLRGQL